MDRHPNLFRAHFQAIPEHYFDRYREFPIIAMRPPRPRPGTTPQLPTTGMPIPTSARPSPTPGEVSPISIIIPSYNAIQFVELCLDSLVPQASDAQAEIILVDSSDDGTAELVRSRYPEVRVIRSDRRLYPAQAKMAGRAAARGKILAMVDADCTVGPEWLHRRLALHLHGHNVVFGSLLPHPDNTVTGWAYYFVEFCYFLRLKTPGVVRQGSGANMSFDASVFDAVRFREESAYGLDVVLDADLREQGVAIQYDPGLPMFHRYHKPFRQFLAHQFHHGRQIETILFRYRWDSLPRWRFWMFLLLGPVIPLLYIGYVILTVLVAAPRFLPRLIAAFPLVVSGSIFRKMGGWWAHIEWLVRTSR
jgi:glycosyltransferase involved in cell wall biosynthesis